MEKKDEIHELRCAVDEVAGLASRGIKTNTATLKIHTKRITELHELDLQICQTIEQCSRAIKLLDARLTALELKYEQETGQIAGQDDDDSHAGDDVPDGSNGSSDSDLPDKPF